MSSGYPESPEWGEWQWSDDHKQYYTQRLHNGQWETQWQRQHVSQQPGNSSDPRTTATQYADASLEANFGRLRVDPGASYNSEPQEYALDAHRADHTFGGYGESSERSSGYRYTDQRGGAAESSFANRPYTMIGDSSDRRNQSSHTRYDSHQYPTSAPSTSQLLGQPRTSEDNIAPSNPNHLQTREDGYDYERLDSSYTRVKANSIGSFFKEGRVFAVLWIEPSSAGSGGQGFTVMRFGEHAYAEIRRFIVVRVHNNFHSICVPIMSYNKKGAVGRADMADHAVAYTSTRPPEPARGESLDRYPIKVEPRGGNTLHPMSRINFSKVYTIEHNLKVKNIGSIPETYMAWVRHYYRASNYGSQPAMQPTVQPQYTEEYDDQDQ